MFPSKYKSLNKINSRQKLILYMQYALCVSFLNSTVVICDLGFPVDFNHSCISFTLLPSPPVAAPEHFLHLCFWTEPSVFSSA